MDKLTAGWSRKYEEGFSRIEGMASIERRGRTNSLKYTPDTDENSSDDDDLKLEVRAGLNKNIILNMMRYR